MAEYIDKDKIPWAKVDNPKGIFWERIVFESAIDNITPADVVERDKVDKAKKQITDSMNEHLASDGTPIDEYAYCYLNALEILEENIGE